MSSQTSMTEELCVNLFQDIYLIDFMNETIKFMKYYNISRTLLSNNRFAVLLGLIYNLGPTKLYKFKLFSSNISIGNFEAAAESLMDSVYCT